MGIAFSKVTTKSQTVIPREVREQLGILPGDRLRYDMTSDGIKIRKAERALEDDPFAVFTEWSGEADEKAYGSL
jgi:antitoxin PrlF